ncbi:hypothetical protein K435DRAFT_785092 [Dendrothele bispora CBS 962.96]|uniref:Uncharacterized protein n=1 Tax=Dendrothele bispora (strain CBS 962.96) TaxID=1314807 RepID=A0A4S8KYY4_DENBC|nr:hypothetical protein K435DRAFT_785092 [Dendrothele bispora CBS 962.96]
MSWTLFNLTLGRNRYSATLHESRPPENGCVQRIQRYPEMPLRYSRLPFLVDCSPRDSQTDNFHCIYAMLETR